MNNSLYLLHSRQVGSTEDETLWERFTPKNKILMKYMSTDACRIQIKIKCSESTTEKSPLPTTVLPKIPAVSFCHFYWATIPL